MVFSEPERFDRVSSCKGCRPEHETFSEGTSRSEGLVLEIIIIKDSIKSLHPEILKLLEIVKIIIYGVLSKKPPIGICNRFLQSGRKLMYKCTPLCPTEFYNNITASGKMQLYMCTGVIPKTLPGRTTAVESDTLEKYVSRIPRTNHIVPLCVYIPRDRPKKPETVDFNTLYKVYNNTVHLAIRCVQIFQKKWKKLTVFLYRGTYFRM